MLFHHRQTQPGVIGDLLVAPALADKLRNFLFAPCQPDKSRQTQSRWRRPGGVRTKILAPDKEVRSRYAGRLELLQMNRRSQMRQSRVMHLHLFQTRLRRVGA
jgi:hypothetical protein